MDRTVGRVPGARLDWRQMRWCLIRRHVRSRDAWRVSRMNGPDDGHPGRSEERRIGKQWWSWGRTAPAEDGIRDYKVTGVQTCALPIFNGAAGRHRSLWCRLPWTAR